MILSVNTNLPSLVAQRHLQSSSSRFETSLERLSTGLRINHSADDPSGLVISEFQRAQIAGLTAAVENIDRAVSLTQTAEGGLSEINALLIELRSLAVDSANNGALDEASLQANQANVDSLLDTIDRIAMTTFFGRRSLLDGSSGQGSAGLEFEDGHTNAHFIGVDGDRLARWPDNDPGTPNVVDILYDFRDQNGFTNNITAGQRARAEDALDAWETSSAGLLRFTQSTTAAAADIINIGTGDLAAVGGMSMAGGVAGIGGIQFSLAPGPFLSASMGFAWMDQDEMFDEILGNGVPPGTIDYFSVAAHEIGHALGLDHTGDIPTTELMDPTISMEFMAPFPEVDRIHIQCLYGDDDCDAPSEPQALIFHVGAAANDNVTLTIDSATTSSLAREVSDSQFLSLRQINVTTVDGAQDSIRSIDGAIADIANQRGRIGAFEQNTLLVTQSNVRSQLINIKDAESVLRDTDFTSEISNFVAESIRRQTATTVLALANQSPLAVVQLLQGQG